MACVSDCPNDFSSSDTRPHLSHYGVVENVSLAIHFFSLTLLCQVRRANSRSWLAPWQRAVRYDRCTIRMFWPMRIDIWIMAGIKIHSPGPSSLLAWLIKLLGAIGVLIFVATEMLQQGDAMTCLGMRLAGSEKQCCMLDIKEGTTGAVMVQSNFVARALRRSRLLLFIRRELNMKDS